MTLDWRYTDKHYPWQKVTRERLQQAHDDLRALGLDLRISEKIDDDRIRWWCGMGCLGYEQISAGEFYLHPMHMEPDELTEFEPIDGFDYLKTDPSIAVQFRDMAAKG